MQNLRETSEAERRKEDDLLHQRSADRILHFIRLNKGLYIKIGQAVSTMNNVLPRAYTQTMAQLRDHAPTVDTSVILQVIEEDLGAPVSTLFREFNAEPLAAASLAQVHEVSTAERPLI